MRIFYAFLIILVDALLWMIPVSEAVYDYQTRLREDNFTVTTPASVTSANVTLTHAIYNDDTSTIAITSESYLDAPLYASYNATSRQLNMTGMAESATRSITVAYDIDALAAGDALNNILSKVPYIWFLCLVILPVAAVAALFMGRA